MQRRESFSAAELCALAESRLLPSGHSQMEIAELFANAQAESRRLEQRLSPILGSLAVRTMLKRALSKSSASYPFLQSIAVYEDGVDTKAQLDLFGDLDYDEAREGLVDFLCNFYGTLASLIGKDLTLSFLGVELAGEDHIEDRSNKGGEGE